jgi:hypothetical protein
MQNEYKNAANMGAPKVFACRFYGESSTVKWEHREMNPVFASATNDPRLPWTTLVRDMLLRGLEPPFRALFLSTCLEWIGFMDDSCAPIEWSQFYDFDLSLHCFILE